MPKFSLSFATIALTANTLFAADSSLTIYNDNFAVVRGTVPLELREGVTEVRFNDTTAHLEPSSVILRDPAGRIALQVLEQNYRADPVTQSLMLSLFEGQTIDFRTEEDHKSTIIQGKIVRSGYDRQSSSKDRDANQPVIEVGGKLRFELPGTPLFPKLADDTILKPELNWKISSPQAAKLEAEIAYITSEMSWSADYNVVAPESGNPLQIVGWITIKNESGKKFENVRTKLVAGEVNKIKAEDAQQQATTERMIAGSSAPVTEKSFDEYHLYMLPRPVTLRDQETKQIEFVRAEGVTCARLYVYDAHGAEAVQPLAGAEPILVPDYETGTNKKVAVILEFKNSEANKLGIALPKGRWRFYRRDDDQQLEFTGENEIDHTAKDETLRVFTGNAFDLVGERKRTNFAVNNPKRTAEESFEIKLRNHKKEPVEIRVVEHLSRWSSWEISAKSDAYTKKDAQTVEFLAQLKPEEERTLTYSVKYVNLPAPPL